MTPKQIEQINRGIAEKLGWKQCRNDGEGNYFDSPDGPFWRDPHGCAGRAIKPENFYLDERTRPQLLAALSGYEKRQFCELLLKGSTSYAQEWAKLLHLDQQTLARLFCAVKNIEIESED